MKKIQIFFVSWAVKDRVLFLPICGENQSSNQTDNNQTDSETTVVSKTKTKLPKKYKVLLHNDDYTTMEFVILVLQRIFKKSIVEAQDITLKVHKNGVGVCGIYSFEVAETKAMQVTRFAKDHGHPLKCTIEPES